MRKNTHRISNVTLGAIVFLILVAASLLAFTKRLPFVDRGYEVNAAFTSSTTLANGSPVRIAGVQVGKVIGLDRENGTSVVTMVINDDGRPIHTDASLKIRPRLFLEGNFFVDLRPGSPSAPELADGGMIPVTQTSRAVQLDEILTTLQEPDRRNLVSLLKGFGGGLVAVPTAAQDVGQDPDVRGQSGASALNDSFKFGGRAGKSTSRVSEALLGTEADDLSGLIKGQEKLFRDLASSETQLRSLITNFNVTTSAFAAESENLSATVRELAPTIEQARPSLVKLNETFPPLREFSNELRPGVRELPDTIAAGLPWLRQARPLVSTSELGGLASQLRKATPDLAAATAAQKGLFAQIGLTSRCGSDVLVPASESVITRPDDPFVTGAPVYKEFFYAAAHQAGIGGGFDGNGPYLRANLGGGPVEATTQNPTGGFENDILYSNVARTPIGVQPQIPAEEPPIRTDVRCHTNDVPDLNGSAAAVAAPSPAP